MSYQQITRAQLRALLTNRLGPLAGAFYVTDEMNRMLQESLRVWNACTGFWHTRAILNTTANTVWYTLPNAITSQMRVSFNDTPMSPCSIPDLDNGRVNWESETTTTGGDVPTAPSLYGIGGVNLIAIWPADATGGNSLNVDGIAATPILSADNTFVDIGEEELQHILDYTEAMLKFKQGKSGLDAATTLLQSFLKGAAARNGMLAANAKFRAAMGEDTGQTSKPRQVAERLGAR